MPPSCNHLWPKAVILTRHEIQTSSQLFSLTKWIFQQPTGSQLTICVFHTRLLFPKRAGVCPETQSLNPPGFRERLAVNQLSWETLILPLARGTHSWTGLFSAHIWFCLNLDKVHVGFCYGECSVGFRVLEGPVVQKALYRKVIPLSYNHISILSVLNLQK